MSQNREGEGVKKMLGDIDALARHSIAQGTFATAALGADQVNGDLSAQIS